MFRFCFKPETKNSGSSGLRPKDDDKCETTPDSLPPAVMRQLIGHDRHRNAARAPGPRPSRSIASAIPLTMYGAGPRLPRPAVSPDFRHAFGLAARGRPLPRPHRLLHASPHCPTRSNFCGRRSLDRTQYPRAHPARWAIAARGCWWRKRSSSSRWSRISLSDPGLNYELSTMVSFRRAHRASRGATQDIADRRLAPHRSRARGPNRGRCSTAYQWGLPHRASLSSRAPRSFSRCRQLRLDRRYRSAMRALIMSSALQLIATQLRPLRRPSIAYDRSRACRAGRVRRSLARRSGLSKPRRSSSPARIFLGSGLAGNAMRCWSQLLPGGVANGFPPRRMDAQSLSQVFDFATGGGPRRVCW